MARKFNIATADGIMRAAFEEVPWRHFHTFERGSEIIKSKGRGYRRPVERINGPVTRDEEEATAWTMKPVPEGRKRELQRCVTRGCGGDVPADHVDRILEELRFGGPADFDPFYTEQSLFAALKERGVEAHVAERTLLDGTILMEG